MFILLLDCVRIYNGRSLDHRPAASSRLNLRAFCKKNRFADHTNSIKMDVNRSRLTCRIHHAAPRLESSTRSPSPATNRSRPQDQGGGSRGQKERTRKGRTPQTPRPSSPDLWQSRAKFLSAGFLLRLLYWNSGPLTERLLHRRFHPMH